MSEITSSNPLGRIPRRRFIPLKDEE